MIILEVFCLVGFGKVVDFESNDIENEGIYIQKIFDICVDVKCGFFLVDDEEVVIF